MRLLNDSKGVFLCFQTNFEVFFIHLINKYQTFSSNPTFSTLLFLIKKMGVGNAKL
jgi:hypothetical protein